MEIRRPDGPRDKLFGLSIMRRMNRDFLRFFQQMQTEYGDVVHLRMLFERQYAFFHPNMIREVLVEKASSFIRWEHGIRIFASVHGNSVLVAEGEEWKQQRHLVKRAFVPRNFASYTRQLARATHEALNTLPVGKPIDYEHAMNVLSMDVILGSMFRTSLATDSDLLERAVTELAESGYRQMFIPFPVPGWFPGMSQHRKQLAAIDTLIAQCIAERRADPEHFHDWVSQLFLEVDATPGSASLSDQNIHDQAKSLFLARHETTSSTLEWLGWVLAEHPDLAARARAEVDAVLGGRHPEYEDIANLPYLGQFIKETMRLYPVAPALFMRRATENVQIGEWSLPKGSLVVMQNYAVHHDSRWFPEPEKFDPERFSPEAFKSIPRGAYFPFGLGPRTCIGSHFAMTEVTLIGAMLLQHFELFAAPGQVKPEISFTVALRPAGGMKLILRKRTPVEQRAALAGSEA
ncbi:Epi-isozizaene 5-monooxygenase/(E)-beta-farnesene synthase [compost metagenome]